MPSSGEDRQEIRFAAEGLSAGIGIGRVVAPFGHGMDLFRVPIMPEAVDDEVARFESVAAATREEIQRTGQEVDRVLGADLVGIFEAQEMLLVDSTFVGRVTDAIRAEAVNAEWALHETVAGLCEQFDSFDHDYLRDRKDCLQDVERLLLRRLHGVAHHDLSELEGDLILVAHDLTPSEAVRLGRSQVAGFVVESVGRTSHTTIIAHSLGVPLVRGAAGLYEIVESDHQLIVDGSGGEVVLHPTAETLAVFRARQRREGERAEELASSRALPATTTDGATVTLAANIDLPEELDEALRFGAQGVGLYRSEFLYIERSPELPSEEEHLEVYRHLLEAAAPHPVVVRTYDLGGRKLAQELTASRERNPVLGLRGVRLTLARPDLFQPQLRALLRAGQDGPLSVMLPLVSSVEEVRAFRRLLESARAELAAEGTDCSRQLPLGVMIEVPAAVWTARQLAAEVDFLSIGTNDLIQYALAVDRSNEHVSHLHDPLHPAVLRMIREVVIAGEELGIPVSLCGEMAADPRYTPLLIGSGLRSLSMSPRRLPEVKARIRALAAEDLKPACRHCRRLASVDEVHHYLEETKLLRDEPQSSGARSTEPDQPVSKR